MNIIIINRLKSNFSICIFIAAAFLIISLLLNIKSAFGNRYKNLGALLKKYSITLRKPKYIAIKRKNRRIEKAPLKMPYPALLEKRISLSGDGSVKSALMLLSREIGAPIIIHRGFPNKLINEAYYNHLPLYEVLGGLITANGFKYTYNNGVISVYAVEEKTFHIPQSGLMSSFSSTVGTAQNNNINNPNISSLNSGQGGHGAGAGSQATQASSGNNSNQNTAVSPNPSGSLSLTLSESDSLYGIISKNIKEMLTKSGKYFINPKDGLIWVKDRVSNVSAVSKYIKGIKKFFSKQVFLKVEVIDVTLNKGFQMGINWNLLFKQAFSSNVLGINDISVSAPFSNVNDINNSPYIGFTGSGNSSAILNALKTQGTADVVSQPRLILMDDQTRLISSGTITPYISSIQTMALSLSQTETYPVISQVQTGLSISFTPHINFKNNTVSVTLSLIDNIITGYQPFSISGESFSNPIIETKSLSDTVNVKSGSTILVGGIITTDKAKNTYEAPLLSKIPLIGNLFKSENDSKKKEDLLIMLTPKIIE